MPVRKRAPKQHPLYAKRPRPSVAAPLANADSDHSDDVIVIAATLAPAVNDKPHSRPSFDVSRLPSDALSRVLSFAVPGYVPVPGCVPKYPCLPVRKLSNVASVSTAWRDAIRKVIQNFRVANLDWTLVAADEEEEYEMLQEEVERRGDQLRSIRIRIDGDAKPADVEWGQVFAACPRLERLDLRDVPLESSLLGLVLGAGSSHCRDMKALILPKRSVSSKATRKVIRANYEKLYQALEKWSPLSSDDTTATGLKQLTVSDRWEDEYLAPSADFLAAITEFCPSLEYLDGWKHAYNVDDFVECDEKWYIPPSTWRQFWESAAGTSLREFNWAVAPFHDAYFQLFAEVLKPNLRHLCLTVSESWTWDDFKVPEDEDELLGAVIAPPTSETLCSVTKAVPQLEQLYVIFHSGIEDPASVDVEAFGDPFL
uniref:F-box domain-containing protein n=1 Tax=Globisporangium ultimum (strain ATCC 200006 / CBS 805.95 / DAOM BR144) TaxID=431595 RepID=K3WMF2_GLOUD